MDQAVDIADLSC
jgi:hypothetical protein